jgi:hypothetical protein
MDMILDPSNFDRFYIICCGDAAEVRPDPFLHSDAQPTFPVSRAKNYMIMQ